MRHISACMSGTFALYLSACSVSEQEMTFNHMRQRQRALKRHKYCLVQWFCNVLPVDGMDKQCRAEGGTHLGRGRPVLQMQANAH